MADIDLKTSTPDTSLPTTGFLFGADSQAASAPSVFTTQAVATTLLGSTTLSGATITASQPVLDLSQTWNNAAVTFTGLKFNATDTASAAASNLLDLGTGGGTYVSRFSVNKAGSIVAGTSTTGLSIIVPDSEFVARASGNAAHFGAYGAYLKSDIAVSWSSSSSAAKTGVDTYLTRRAAANLRLGAADAAAPVAQTLSVQSGTAGASALSCSISGTTLTVGGAVTGTIAIGHAVTGTGVSAGTVITAGSGTTWTVNNSQTVSSTTMYFNSVGQNLTITGSQGSGPSAGGSIVFQVAPAGSAGTTAQNALATALTIDSTRLATFALAAAFPGGSTTTLPIQLSAATYGFYRGVTQGGQSVITTCGGTDIFAVGQNSGVGVVNTGPYSWASTIGSTADLLLHRDAANTLALRNGANAQAFNVYNTFTDASNYERGKIAWSSNVLQIGTEKAGTGTARALEFQTDGTTRLTISTAGNATVTGWIKSNLYFDAPAALLGGNGGIYFGTAGANGSQVQSTGAGVIALGNYGGSDFNRIQFGGTTSSFPALKRSSTTLQARLADDSAFAGFASANMQAATAYTVATLPGTPGTGMIARVTDALAPTIGATVTGGGAAYALVNYNGANWTVIGV